MAGAATSASATDGYFLNSVGAKAKGETGVAIALSQEALSIAANPAAATELGDPLAPLSAGVPFGANGGPGFGWRNITVVKAGASYRFSPALTLRAGRRIARAARWWRWRCSAGRAAWDGAGVADGAPIGPAFSR